MWDYSAVGQAVVKSRDVRAADGVYLTPTGRNCDEPDLWRPLVVPRRGGGRRARPLLDKLGGEVGRYHNKQFLVAVMAVCEFKA